MALTVFGQLDRSLHDHLAALVRRADQADGETAVELARSELPRVVAALKSLLDEHQPDERGRCGTCRRRWSGLWGRRSTAPCRAYIGAQLCLAVAGPRPVVGPRDALDDLDGFEDALGDAFRDTWRAPRSDPHRDPQRAPHGDTHSDTHRDTHRDTFRDAGH